jgi:ESCRT-II complex subunit VPS36
VDSSPHSHVKLSFKSGGCEKFGSSLRSTLEASAWKNNNLLAGSFAPSSDQSSSSSVKKPSGAGILGIERSIQARHRETGEHISRAFQDMSVLMSMASDMVKLSKAISQKMRERKGSVSDDETIEFKSALLRLGVSQSIGDGAPGDSAGLATEMAAILKRPMKVRQLCFET